MAEIKINDPVKFECKIHIGIPDASLIMPNLATLSVYSIDKLAHHALQIKIIKLLKINTVFLNNLFLMSPKKISIFICELFLELIIAPIHITDIII
jgi:hypothetical protein